MAAALRRWIAAFGRFWWDFAVGETPELAVGVLVLIGVALALRGNRMIAVVALPLLCAILLVVSTLRGRRRVDRSPRVDQRASPESER